MLLTLEHFDTHSKTNEQIVQVSYGFMNLNLAVCTVMNFIYNSASISKGL